MSVRISPRAAAREMISAPMVNRAVHVDLTSALMVGERAASPMRARMRVRAVSVSMYRAMDCSNR